MLGQGWQPRRAGRAEQFRAAYCAAERTILSEPGKSPGNDALDRTLMI
jgi:hypothetical protein